MKLATLRWSRSAAICAAALTGGETRNERTAVFRFGRDAIRMRYKVLQYPSQTQAINRHMYSVTLVICVVPNPLVVHFAVVGHQARLKPRARLVQCVINRANPILLRFRPLI
jgi:hypothetical protein